MQIQKQGGAKDAIKAAVGVGEPAMSMASNSITAMLGIAFGISGLVGMGAGYTLSKATSPTYQKPANTQREYLKDKLLNEVEKANIELESQRKQQQRAIQAPSKGIMI